ncbi:MAG: hypothetical protein LBJ31_03600 [Treponema sp.]|jgi:hypothetical protein|nr:hypothetical protein [Treponema sp.]
MTRNRYEALKKAYGRYASWAVWGEGDEVYNLIEQAVPSLHADYVFAGLNASQELEGQVPWTNYHSHSGSREKIFASIFGRPPFGGAYITGIVKDCPRSSTTEVLDFLKKDKTALDRNVKTLVKELAALGPVGKVILIGGAAEKIWKSRRELDRYSAYPITHFSVCGGIFPDTAPEERITTNAANGTEEGITTTNITSTNKKDGIFQTKSS